MTDSSIRIGLPMAQKLTGKLIPIFVVLTKFVLLKKIQIRHSSSKAFDFLYDTAKLLQDKKSMVYVGGGPAGKHPLIFKGTKFRGFLEGRVKEKSYSLVLHLSNLELKKNEYEVQGIE